VPVHLADETNVGTRLPSYSRCDKFSPNLCDPTSWWYSATEVVGGTLTRQSSTVYTFSHTNIIDLNHGKISDEDELFEDFGLVVYVNSVEKTIDTPFTAGGDADYSVNYATGTVTFNSAVSESDSVTADYHYENGSLFKILPATDKVLTIIGAECQLSSNVVLNDTTIYEIWGRPYAGGTFMKLKEKKYKHAIDFLNESNGAYPAVPAFGGTYRGTQQSTLIFPWNYKVRSDLPEALDFEIRVYLENDTAHTGEFGTVTFYCTSVDA